MKKLLLLLALLLGGLTAQAQVQSSKEHAYEVARAAASSKPALARIGAGLRFRMDSVLVEHHLDSLRQRKALVWPFGTEQLVAEALSVYHYDQLVKLHLLLLRQSDVLKYEAVVASLKQAYGQEFAHGLNGRLHSWFTAGIEIELLADNGSYELLYTDLHRPIFPGAGMVRKVRK